MTLRYSSEEEAHAAHIERYKADRQGKVNSLNDPRNMNRIAFFVDRVKEKSHVLDVGCNIGTISHPLKVLKNCRVKGVDVVEGLVYKARKKGIFAKVGLAEKLEFTDEYFDHVVCGEVLEHLFDPGKAVSEAYRVLKKNGSYLITVPNNEEELGYFHHQRFTPESLESLIRKNGFDNSSLTIFGISSGDYVRDDMNIARWIGCEVFK
jgi:2-polyprenyl-3-methyl-5-hydroxy-6-metoxy-1,4-benzoquinol methylase